jgi:hypothetical protein
MGLLLRCCRFLEHKPQLQRDWDLDTQVKINHAVKAAAKWVAASGCPLSDSWAHEYKGSRAVPLTVMRRVIMPTLSARLSCQERLHMLASCVCVHLDRGMWRRLRRGTASSRR